MYDESYLAYQLQSTPLRRKLRRFYFNAVLRHVLEPAIDLGCGTGGFLSLLSSDSFGLEVNSATVEYCQNRGMDVRLFSAEEPLAPFLKREIGGRRIRSITCLHVLEHLDDPGHRFQELLEASRQLDIERLIFAVPGRVGFRHDPTHRTFIDRQFFYDQLRKTPHWRLLHDRYFPIPWEKSGDFLRHIELHFVVGRSSSDDIASLEASASAPAA